MMEHAVGSQLPERMFSQAEPITKPFDVDPDSFESLINKLTPGYEEWQSYEVQSNPRPELEEHKGMPAWFEGITDKLHLEDVEWSYCGSKNFFVSEWREKNRTCPRCGKPSLKCVAVWVT